MSPCAAGWIRSSRVCISGCEVFLGRCVTMDKETAETLLNGHLGTCSADQLDCSFMVFGCSYEILPSVRIGPELGGAYDFRDVYFCKAHNAVHLCRDDICQGNCMTDSVTIRCAISGRALSDKIRSWPRDASLRLSEDKLLKLNDAVMSVWRETHAWTVPSYGHQCYRPSCAIDELCAAPARPTAGRALTHRLAQACSRVSAPGRSAARVLVARRVPAAPRPHNPGPCQPGAVLGLPGDGARALLRPRCHKGLLFRRNRVWNQWR